MPKGNSAQSSSRRVFPPAQWRSLRKDFLDAYEEWKTVDTKAAGFSQIRHWQPFTDWVAKVDPDLLGLLLSKVPTGEARLQGRDSVKRIITRKPRKCPLDACGNVTFNTGYCSRSCRARAPDVQARGRRTSLERYGVDNFAKSKEFSVRFKETCRAKWGVDHHSQTDWYKELARERHARRSPEEKKRTHARIQETLRKNLGENYREEMQRRCMEAQVQKYGSAFFGSSEGKKAVVEGMVRKHGVTRALQADKFRRKRAATCRARFGGEPSGNKDVRARIERTNRERFGVSRPGLLGSTRYKVKTVAAGGRVFKCLGYEDAAIVWLLKKGIPAKSIRTSFDLLEKNRIVLASGRAYYPDLRVGKHVVEVKSSWTLANDFRKLKECYAEVPNFYVMVMDKHGQRLPISTKELLSLSLEGATERLRELAAQLHDSWRASRNLPPLSRTPSRRGYGPRPA